MANGSVLNSIREYSWPSVLVTQGLLDEHASYEKYYSTIPHYLSAYAKWIRVSHSTAEPAYAKKFQIPIPQVITNGVDMNEWSRPLLDLRRVWGLDQKPWVLNVSNHSPVKNHNVYYHLANYLRNLGAHFTLASGTYPMNKWGLGRLEFRRYLSCRLRNIIYPDVVDLRVNLSRDQVVSAIREADIVVSTSRKEANSIVLLESMAARTPWVSFDVGSARENGAASWPVISAKWQNPLSDCYTIPT